MELSLLLVTLFITLFLLAGLGLVSLALHFWQKRIILSSSDLAPLADVVLLAEIPVYPPGLPLPALRDERPVLNPFQILQSNVSWALAPRARLRLLVTSPGRGEGKSFVAANLAVALARRGERVLLVDGCLDRPQLHSWFELDNEAGLTTLLQVIQDTPTGQGDWMLNLVERYVQPTGIADLYLLASGPPIDMPPPMRLPDTVFAAFDSVIVDAPAVPLLAGFLERSEGQAVLLVAAAGRTRLQALKAAAAGLRAPKARVLGLVLNRAFPLVSVDGQEPAGEVVQGAPAVMEPANAPLPPNSDGKPEPLPVQAVIAREKEREAQPEPADPTIPAATLVRPPASSAAGQLPRHESWQRLSMAVADANLEKLSTALRNQHALGQVWEWKARELARYAAGLRQAYQEMGEKSVTLQRALEERERELADLRTEAAQLRHTATTAEAQLVEQRDKLAAAWLTIEHQREELLIYSQLFARLESTADKIAIEKAAAERVAAAKATEARQAHPGNGERQKHTTRFP